MASPPAGVDPNQWGNAFVADMRRRGENPVMYGFQGTQQEQDDWARQSQQWQPQPKTAAPSQQRATLGGPDSDPRWSHNGGPWQSGRQPAPQPSRQGGGFAIYSPSQAQSQQSPWATSTPYGQQPAWDQQMPFGGQSFGIPSFQFQATDFMGNQFDNPGAFTAQQGAMAQALNQQRSQQISQGSFGSLNPALAYQQGQQMIQDGWQNPFAPPAVEQRSQQVPFDPGPLQGGWNFTTHPGHHGWSEERMAAGLQPGTYEEFLRELRGQEEAARQNQATPPVMSGGRSSPVRGSQDPAGDRVRRLRGNPPASQYVEQPPPRFGTAPAQRGRARTDVFQDSDRDGVDDRDQDGPGMPSYGRPNSKTAVPPQYSFGSSDFGMPQQWPQNDSERVARPTVSMPFAPRGPQTPAPRRQSIFVPRNPSLPSRRGSPRPLYPGQPGYAQAARQRR